MKSWLICCIASFWLLSACDDGVQAVKVEGHAKKPFEQNAVDAAGVAEGDEQVSPNGRPAY